MSGKMKANPGSGRIWPKWRPPKVGGPVRPNASNMPKAGPACNRKTKNISTKLAPLYHCRRDDCLRKSYRRYVDWCVMQDSWWLLFRARLGGPVTRRTVTTCLMVSRSTRRRHEMSASRWAPTWLASATTTRTSSSTASRACIWLLQSALSHSRNNRRRNKLRPHSDPNNKSPSSCRNCIQYRPIFTSRCT